MDNTTELTTARRDNWDARCGDDIRDLRDRVAAGEIDFAELEIA